MRSFDELQAGLADALGANRPGSTTEHVLVALPSYSVGATTLQHYADRLAALEHRYLVAYTLLGRVPGARLVLVTCESPGDEVIDYYDALLAPEARAGARSRFRTLVVPDRAARPVAAKLLDRPDLIDELRDWIGGRPAFIEPWNVTAHEVEVATRLQVPVNGTSPQLWPIAYKAAGRRLLRRAGVPVPYGVEDVRSLGDVVEAALAVRTARPGARAVVVKHDDSVAGDGNAVLPLAPDGEGLDAARTALARHVAALPDWYVGDLSAGGVVEELVAGVRVSSPSAQGDILPSGEIVVLSTHEQVLGGENGHVYTGCRFPADQPYAAELARHCAAAGRELAEAGATGRFGVDFVAAEDVAGSWRIYALEINLRKGGTTPPFTELRHLVPGHYDTAEGTWRTGLDGSPRAYRSSDNLVHPQWLGLPPAAVMAAVSDAGLRFDHSTGTGVVLHMLSCLAVDGRMGVTAIGRDPAHADELYGAVEAAVHAAARRR